MKSLKLTSLFSILAVMSSVAIAQPPAPAPGEGSPRAERGEHRGNSGGRFGGERSGSKLSLASDLENLTPEQKTKLKSLDEKIKSEREAKREENRAAMEKIRTATPEERREAMDKFRKQREEENKKLDAELAAILTPEQQKTLESKTSETRGRMGERFGRRGADDRATSGPWAGRRGERGEGRGEGRKPGEVKAKDGDKAGKAKKAKPADAATTGTATNPFAN